MWKSCFSDVLSLRVSHGACFRVLGVSACYNKLALNRLSIKVTFIYKEFLA